MRRSAERRVDESEPTRGDLPRRADPLALQVESLQRTIGNAATARLIASRRTTPAILRDATGTAEDMEKLGYDAITKAMGSGVERFTYQNIDVQPNGELFIEFRQMNAKSDDVRSQAVNSYDEKLHVPATADDIAVRTDIVTRLCLEMGFSAFKTTRPEKLRNVKPGAPLIWQMLKDAGLADDAAYDAGRGIHTYLGDALHADRREALVALLKKHGPVPPDPQGYGTVLSSIADSLVADSGIFPSEQRGREITIYIDVGFKPEAWWATFAKALVTRMQAAGLPRLPIAAGDQAVTGEGEPGEGGVRAYFSSRDEAMAMDSVLQTRGFPIWYGSNAQQSRAAGQSLIFDMDLNAPGATATANTAGDETVVNAHVAPTMLEMFTGWLKNLFGSLWPAS